MKLYQYIIFSFTITNLAFAGNVDSLFLKATEHYTNEEYSLAANNLEEIVESGYFNAEVFYNLGNSYYKLNRIAESIGNYERALLLGKFTEDTEFNLAIARLQLVDKIEEIPDFIIKVWYFNLVLLLKSNTWFLLAILSLIFSALAFSMYWFTKKLSQRRIGLVGSIAALGLSLILIKLSADNKALLFENNEAIILSPTAIVKASPNHNSTEIVVLHEGTKVDILSRYNDFNEIRIADGNIGWLPADDLFEIRLPKN
jgi:tetratricopeptide (TPR) repeat protein